MRDPDGNWYGFSSRARVIVYNKAAVKAADVPTYESLADPTNKGKVCTRAGSHPYNLSLVAALISHNGRSEDREWAKGVVANMARTPRGGDTDQIKGVAAGECAIALSNTYYYVAPAALDEARREGDGRRRRASSGRTSRVTARTSTSPARECSRMRRTAENAIKFLEYLASDSAQAYFANGNNEWPAVKSAVVKNPELDSLGTFKADPLPIATLGKNTAAAQKLLDRAGWK